jgi:cysteine desulfurase
LSRIYLDNCANTPAAPEVIQAMAAALAKSGNPSSIHHEGRRAAHLLRDARQTVAESIGARPAEIVFCGSGTEANNLAIGGILSRAIREKGRARVVTSTVEHASIRTRLAWEKRAHGDQLDLVEIGVDGDGALRMDELSEALGTDTTLAAFLLVNNETGVVQNLDLLKQHKLAHPNIPFLLDAVQAQGKLALDMRLLPFDLLSFSAHKIYGPAGVGALYVRGGLELDPLVFGGSQEKFHHAGTENLAGIVGFAEAINLLPPPDETNGKLADLEAVYLEELRRAGCEFQINGPTDHWKESATAGIASGAATRLPGFLNLSFSGVADRGDLQIALDLAGVSLSSTSACHSGVTEESHVLAAMGIDGERRSGAVRLLFSRYHTVQDARRAAEITSATVARIRNATASPVA